MRSRRSALPGRPMGMCWPCGQPSCCPQGSGRAPAEAGRPRGAAQGAGLLLRSCWRSAARAFSRRRPCPVLAFLLHCLSCPWIFLMFMPMPWGSLTESKTFLPLGLKKLNTSQGAMRQEGMQEGAPHLWASGGALSVSR